MGSLTATPNFTYYLCARKVSLPIELLRTAFPENVNTVFFCVDENSCVEDRIIMLVVFGSLSDPIAYTVDTCAVRAVVPSNAKINALNV
jgi:hypothetical protein